LTKPDHDNDRMQKKTENVAHVQDGVKLNKPQSSGRLPNSPIIRSNSRVRQRDFISL